MNLILVANPGSSSRKYALYDTDGLALHAEIHYEHAHDGIVYTIESPGKTAVTAPADFSVLDESCSHVISTLATEHLLTENQPILAIGLRVVAPSAFFMQDHVITDEVVTRLESIKHLAPLHIGATLGELQLLRAHYPDTPIVVFDDLLANRQSQASALWLTGMSVADLMEFLEDQLMLVSGDARAIVDDLDAPATQTRLQANGYFAVLFRTEFYRIGQQVDDNLG